MDQMTLFAPSYRYIIDTSSYFRKNQLNRTDGKYIKAYGIKLTIILGAVLL